MANNDNGLLWIIVFVLAIIYWIVMIIIEYFVFFLILGLIIWAIYYYAQNAPKWEKERAKRTSFTSNNTKNHTNFKVLYVTAEKNIEALKSSFLTSRDNIEIKGKLPYSYDGTDRIAKFSKDLKSVYHYTKSPSQLYKEGMGVTKNPYVSATQTVDSLINETIRIPNILFSLEKRCQSLRKKGIDSDRFNNILNSVSSDFAIDNHRRLSLLVEAESKGDLEKAVGSSPASTIKV